MSRNSGNLIICCFHKGGNDNSVEGTLEVVGHIVSQLTDSMACSVSDFGVVELKVFDQDGNHCFNLVNLFNILTNLGESHNTGVLETPVLICDAILDECGNEREHFLLADARS